MTIIIILLNFRTGAQVVLPTASVVSAAFKRERRVLVQMVVLVLVYVICWMPFWILYTWFWACNHIHWMHMSSEQWQSGERVIIQTIYGFDDIIVYKILWHDYISYMQPNQLLIFHFRAHLIAIWTQ